MTEKIIEAFDLCLNANKEKDISTCGLCDGFAGLLLCAYYLKKKTNDKRYDDVISIIVDKQMANLGQRYDLGYGLAAK